MNYTAPASAGARDVAPTCARAASAPRRGNDRHGGRAGTGDGGIGRTLRFFTPGKGGRTAAAGLVRGAGSA